MADFGLAHHSGAALPLDNAAGLASALRAARTAARGWPTSIACSPRSAPRPYVESLLNCPACKAKPLGMLCPFDCTSKLGQVSESSYNLACLAAVAGAQDEALEWLAKAVATGFNKPDVAMRDDELASVAFLPAFDALLKRMRGKKRAGPKSPKGKRR